MPIQPYSFPMRIPRWDKPFIAGIGIACGQAMAELGVLFSPGPNIVKEVPRNGKSRRTG